MNIINESISAIIQIIIFTLIPLLIFLLKQKTVKGFLGYIGLKKSTKKANILAVVACLLFAAPVLGLTFISEDFKQLMLDPSSVTGKFNQMDLGIKSIVILIIIAVFKTALAEEIFFRGYLAKILIKRTGYLKGNFIQAFIFGIIHAGLFAFTTKDPLFLSVIFIVPAIGAFVAAYLNEKVGKGSIIPGWISHGLANVLAYSIVGFLI